MILDYTRLLRRHIAACVVIAATTASFAASTGNTAVAGREPTTASRVVTVRLPLNKTPMPPFEVTADTAEPELALEAAPKTAFAAPAMAITATDATAAAIDATADAPATDDSGATQLAAATVKRTYKPIAAKPTAASAKPVAPAVPAITNATYTKPAYPTPKTTKAFRGIRLAATSALAVDTISGEALYFKNPDRQMSIASITKLMTAIVVLDAKLPLQEILTISTADVDRLKHTTSRLPVGTKLNRQEMLRLALMSSENRAASALSRHYPGGQAAFLKAMQRKATALGMHQTRFNDPTGLTPTNVSTAKDLVKMVKAASQYPLIRKLTTTVDHRISVNSVRHPLEYRNSNRLVRAGRWNITLSKTGFINEAGHCLVMMTTVGSRPIAMVFLDTQGKLTPLGDATRLRDWIAAGGAGMTVATAQ